jgi:hypothetical protein
MSTDLIVTGFGGVVVLLLTLAGFLFNRWMADLRESIQTLCASNKKDHEDMKDDFREHDHVIEGSPEHGYKTAGLVLEARR